MSAGVKIGLYSARLGRKLLLLRGEGHVYIALFAASHKDVAAYCIVNQIVSDMHAALRVVDDGVDQNLVAGLIVYPLDGRSEASQIADWLLLGRPEALRVEVTA